MFLLLLLYIILVLTDAFQFFKDPFPYNTSFYSTSTIKPEEH